MKNELGVILMVILFAILSIVFGVMAYLNFTEIAGGDKPANAPDAKIAEERKKIDEFETKIAEYTDRKVKLNDEIGKQLHQVEFLKSEAREIKLGQQRRFEQKQAGLAFKKQVEDNAATVGKVKSATLSKVEADINHRADRNGKARHRSQRTQDQDSGRSAAAENGFRCGGEEKSR